MRSNGYWTRTSNMDMITKEDSLEKYAWKERGKTSGIETNKIEQNNNK